MKKLIIVLMVVLLSVSSYATTELDTTTFGPVDINPIIQIALWTNDTGFGQMCSVQILLTNLESGAAALLTPAVTLDDSGTDSFHAIIPLLASITKGIGTTKIIVLPLQYYVPNGGSLKVLMTSNDATADDDEVSGTVWITSGYQSTDTVLVGGATPESFDDVISSPTTNSAAYYLEKLFQRFGYRR